MSTVSSPAGPLDGIRVLEVGTLISGPFAGRLLGDMGAEVIKIEPPGAPDPLRPWGQAELDGHHFFWTVHARNKKAVTLDLRVPRGRDLFLELVEKSDIIVENFRPGVMDRFGLGYSELAKIKPELVYCTISGFGSTGPYANRGGFDLVAQGMSGLMSIPGHPDRPPAKVGVPITDISAGLLAANGVLCAYIHAQRTGQGQMVDTSLMEAGISYTVWESSGYFPDGNIPAPLGSAHRVSAPYQALSTSDGHINIGAATQPTWEQFCRAIGQEALIEDPRFKIPGDRKKREVELAALLEETLTQKTTKEWLDLLESAGVVAGPIYNMEQVYQDPQTQARGMRVVLEDPELGTLHNIGIPVKLSVTPGSIRRRAPALGEHSSELLREAGFYQEEITALLESQVVTEGGNGSGR